MSVTKRKFTREFKLQVVNEVESGVKTRAQVTREYELSEGLLGKWIYSYRRNPDDAFTGHGHGYESTVVDKLESRISQLEGALGRKTMEVEILKKTMEKLGQKKGTYISLSTRS